MSAQPLMTPVRQLHGIVPVLTVSNVVRLAEYYRDALGFTFDRYWGNPPCFVMLLRDRVELFLSSSPATGRISPNKMDGAPWDAYIWVEDVALLLEEFRERGAKITSGPEATFYHTIEIVVEDPDGHRLCFAQDTANEV